MSGDATSAYKLQASYAGHSGDVRAVAFSPLGVVSASRDGTARALEQGENYTLLEAGVYLNSVAVSQSMAYIGAQDGTITSVELSNSSAATPVYFLGHENNVCALTISDGALISGSWDKTARVWNLTKPESPPQVLKGHTEAVWAVYGLASDDVLTASADKTIVRWKKGVKTHTYVGHTDAVRGLCKIGTDAFASCSNDGTVKIWSLSGNLLHTLSGHTSFVYSVAYHEQSDTLFSSGEDRTVRLWRNGRPIQTITLPTVSIWTVAVNDQGTLAVGSSDHSVRLFTQKKDKWASAEELAAFDASVSSSSLGEDQVGSVDESQLADPSTIERPGNEGQIALIKVRGVIEAHQYSTGSWIKVGEVVGRSSDGAKQTHNGKKYDFVFDVDVRDGEPPLKLPFNNSDNVYTVAEKFVTDNNLSSNYVEEVVRFLITNTQSTRLDQSKSSTSAASSAPYTSTAPTSSSSPTAGSSTSSELLAYNKPLAMVSFQATGLVKAFQKSAAIHGDDNIEIEPLLASLPSSASELLKMSITAANDWDIENMLPALDALRIAIPDAEQVPVIAVATLLLGCLEPTYPKHAMLATRAFANMAFRAQDGRTIIAKQRQIFSQALEMLMSFSTVSGPHALSIATFLLNLAVQDFAGELAGTCAWLSGKVEDPEASYRLALAIGVRVWRVPAEVGLLRRTEKWLKSGASGEDRFKELAKEITPRLA